MEQKTILLLEDDKIYAKKCIRFFENNHVKVLYAGEEDTGLFMYTEYNTGIDFIMISESLSEENGLDIIGEIREYSDVPIFYMMNGHDYNKEMKAYREGADECVNREIPFDLLKMKIDVFMRRTYGEDASVQEGILELDIMRRTVKVDGEFVNITVKEFELLYYFMTNKHAIQTRDQILSAVWGINYDGSDRVVDSLVKKLRIKLKKAARYIKTAYGMGYYFERPITESA